MVSPSDHPPPQFFQPARDSVSDVPYGDVMDDQKPTSTFRVTSLNENGLPYSRSGHALRDRFDEILFQNSDVHCMMEHNMDTNQYSVRDLCHTMARRTFPHFRLQMTSSPLQTHSAYKPGGTGILCTGNMVGRTSPTTSDALGRWTSIRCRLTHTKNLYIIAAYQVCARPTNVTGITAYHQQAVSLRTENQTNDTPRSAFRRDLYAFLQKIQQDGDYILLTGDFNENLDNTTIRTGIVNTIQRLGLVDVWLHRHGPTEHQSPATYKRGQTRLDGSFVSPDLLPMIIATGYSSFSAAIHTDHRQQHIDFDLQQLLQGPVHPLDSPTGRGLQSKRPQSVTTYITQMYQHLEANNFFNHLKTLEQATEPDPHLAEKLDRMLIEGSITGENHCRRTPRPWWSTKLHQQRRWVTALSALRTSYRRRTAKRDALQLRLYRQSIDRQLPQTASECSEMLQQAQLELRDMISQSRTLREDEQLTRIRLTQTNTKNQTSAEILKALYHKERTAATFAKFRMARRGPITSSMTTLQIPTTWPHDDVDSARSLSDPKTATSWRTIDSPDDLRRYLTTRNLRHFGQAQGTPFTELPLSEEIDWSAGTRTADLLLEGEYETKEYDFASQLLLRHCQKTTTLDSLPATIDLTDFHDKFKKWCENMTTSPSGRHLGHFKALFARTDIPRESPSYDRFVEHQQAILSAYLTLLNYAVKFRHVYDRWRNIVNVMIHKSPGDQRIHRLRVIHIYEADYNFLLSIKWRLAVHKAEQEQTFHPEQYGGRPGREAASLALLEELKVDISYATRRPLITFDNDASSCYDRIIPSLASLAGRKFGLHRDVVHLNAETLRTARYHLKTATGVSPEWTTHQTNAPIYGTGQGSGNSPVIWTMISSILFDAHQSKAHGAFFTNPRETISHYLSMVGFVDDSTGQVNDLADREPSPLPTLLRWMQHDAQLWTDLLWASGGLLELLKCSFHFLHFGFRPDGRPHPEASHKTDKLGVRDAATGRSTFITPKSVYADHKTLGHYKAPAGNSSAQFEALVAKAKSLLHSLVTIGPTATEAQLYYYTIFLPAMKFPLPQSHLSMTQLRHLDNQTLPTLASRCGYNRFTARAILYGPRSLGGCNFTPFYVLQGEGQTMNFLKHWRSPHTSIGQILRIAVHWTQQLAGVSWPILQFPSRPLPHLEVRWLRSLRNFLAKINGSIEVNDTGCYPAQRVHDRHLMDIALNDPAYTDLHICQINCCRLYLQVTTVSDITRPDGAVDTCFMAGTPSLLSSTAKHRYPEQAKPNPKSWRVWHRFWNSHLIHPNFALRQTLGDWIYSAEDLGRLWPSYIDPRRKVVYLKMANGYGEAHRISNAQSPASTYRYRLQHRIPTQPQPLARALPYQVQSTEASVLWHTAQTLPTLAPAPPIPRCPLDYRMHHVVQQLPSWEQSLLTDHQTAHHPSRLIALLANPRNVHPTAQPHHAILVSDGSVQGSSMAFGWVVTFTDGYTLATGSGIVQGNTPSSGRAETYGLLSGLRFLYQLFRHFGEPQDHLHIRAACDNSSVVERVNTFRTYPQFYPNTTLVPDWDVYTTIVETLNKAPFRFALEHVKGHQDDYRPVDELPIIARLNVQADQLATSAIQPLDSTHMRVPMFPAAHCQLHIGTSTITTHHQRAIRTSATLPGLRTHIGKRRHWSVPQLDQIHWEAHATAIRRWPPNSPWLTKVIHEILPFNQRMHKRDPHHPSKCPFCDQPEDFSHFLQCHHESKSRWRSNLMQGLLQGCERHQVRPILQDFLQDGMRQWLTGTQQPQILHTPTNCTELLQTQAALGWQSWFHGYVPLAWARLQDEYLAKHPHKTFPGNSGSMWLATCITTLWQHMSQLWQQRNEKLHGPSHQSILQREIVSQQIRDLHHQKPLAQTVDADLFEPDVDRFIERSSTTHLRNWVTLYHTAIRDSVRKARQSAIQHTPTIDRFFPPQQPPATPRPRPRTHRHSNTLHDGTRPTRHKPPGSMRTITSFFRPRAPSI